jgi:hypothetical protein
VIQDQSNAQPAFAPETPVNGAAGGHDARDLFSELLLQRRPPRHKLEAKTIIDHGEPPRRERDALAIDAGDVLAFGGRAMREASLSGEF